MVLLFRKIFRGKRDDAEPTGEGDSAGRTEGVETTEEPSSPPGAGAEPVGPEEPGGAAPEVTPPTERASTAHDAAAPPAPPGPPPTLPAPRPSAAGSAPPSGPARPEAERPPPLPTAASPVVVPTLPPLTRCFLCGSDLEGTTCPRCRMTWADQ